MVHSVLPMSPLPWRILEWLSGDCVPMQAQLLTKPDSVHQRLSHHLLVTPVFSSHVRQPLLLGSIGESHRHWLHWIVGPSSQICSRGCSSWFSHSAVLPYKRLISHLLATSRSLDCGRKQYTPLSLCSLDHVTCFKIFYH